MVADGTVSFGSPANLAAPVLDTGSFSLTCTLSVHYNIGLGTGQNSASVTTRRMQIGTGPSLYLTYSLFLDSGRTTNWGLTSPNVVTGNGNGNPQNFSVYGKLDAQTTSGAGAYSDTVQIVVSY